MMEKINGNKSSLSPLQQEQLEILKCFIHICEEKNLRYYLVGGSMIGAVRHHGFIPWDDDVDVSMPRKDYDTFLSCAPEMLPDQYYLETPREKEHFLIVANIYSKQKGYYWKNAKDHRAVGAYIDILVTDGVPDPGIRRELHWFHYMALRAMYQIAHFDEAVNQDRERPRIEKMIIGFARTTKIQRFLNPVRINDSIEKLLRKYDFDDANYVANYCGIYRKKEIVPKAWFGNPTKYQFEDIQVCGIEHPDEYLTQIYGDYMKPMKVEGREHLARAD